ncbi:hypothetical protein H9P43_001565 [Blastocladiella emersonii ATCC 22665]|nr:hypothetical protein H9P43_001565 [Blastocladiella emersonii ATCC 22665]
MDKRLDEDLLAVPSDTMARAQPASSARGTGRRAGIDRVLPVNAMEQTLFQVAYITTRDNDFSPKISWILAGIEELQWLSFSWCTELHPEGFPQLLAGIAEPLRFLDTYGTFYVASVIAIAMVLLTVALIALVVFAMHRQTKAPLFALRLLRLLCTLMITALSIPFATLFISGVHCFTGELPEYHEPCTSTRHLPILVLDAICFTIFAPLILLGSVVFIECSPTSASPMARAHSRTDLLAVALRLTFVVLDVFLKDQGDAALWVYMIVVAGGLAYLAAQFARSQPYFDSRMTILRIAFTVAGLLSMLTTMAIRAAGSPSGGWVAVIPAALVGLFGGAYAGHIAINRQLDYLLRGWHRILAAEQSETDPAIRGSPSSNTALPAGPDAGPQRSTSGLPQLVVPNGPTIGRGSAPSSVSGTANLNRRQSLAPGRTANQRRESHAVALELLNSIDDTHRILGPLLKGTSREVLNVLHERQPQRRVRVFDSPLQVEVCIRFIRSNPTAKQILLGLQLLERGLVEYPKDPLLLLLAATYLGAYFGPDGERAAEDLLDELHQSMHKVPLDIKFLTYTHERSSRDRGEHVLDRASFDSLARDLRRHHLAALYSLRDLWDAVRTGGSNEQLTNIFSRLAVYQAGARKCFNRLIERDPRDKSILRAYAQFLTCVEADPFKAAQILEIADEVEAAEGRMRSPSLSSLEDSGPEAFVPSRRGSFFGPRPSLPPPAPSRGGLASPPPGTVTPSKPPSSAMHRPPTASTATAIIPRPASMSSSQLDKIDAPPTPVTPSTAVSPPSEDHVLFNASVKVAGDASGLLHDNSRELSFPRASASLEAMSGGGAEWTAPEPITEHEPAVRSSKDYLKALSAQPSRPGPGDYGRPTANLTPIRTGGSGSGGIHAPSQTSGTSVSRAERQRMHLRRVILDRISQPLKGLWRTAVPAVLFLVSVVVGYVLCLAFFGQTIDVLNMFDRCRSARLESLAIVESLRGMVFSNTFNASVPLGLNATRIRNSLAVGSSLLTPLSAWETTTSVTAPQFRFFTVEPDTGGARHVSANDFSPMDVFRLILQAGNLGVGLAAPGRLTAERFLATPELRVLVDNHFGVFDGLRALAEMGVQEYNVLVGNTVLLMMLSLSLSLCFLLFTIAVTYFQLIKRYLRNQDHVFALLARMPKRTAANLLTGMEEEIESFRDVTATDNDDDLELELKRTAPSTNGAPSAAGAVPRRRREFQLASVSSLAVIGVLVLAMFLVALGSTSLRGNIRRINNSLNRRFFSAELRFYTWELYGPDSAIRDDEAIRGAHSSLLDLSTLHTALVNDPDGMSKIVPDYTIQPRNCTILTNCPGVVENAEIGFTIGIASMPLNSAIDRYIRVSSALLDQLAMPGVSLSNTSSPAFTTWRLQLAMMNDLGNRLFTTNSKFREVMLKQLDDSTLFCTIAFLANLVSIVTIAAIFYIRGPLKLRREAYTIVSVLHLIPQSALAEAPPIAKFLEQGGISLEIAARTDGPGEAVVR